MPLDGFLRFALASLLFLFGLGPLAAQPRTVGLLQYDSTASVIGYTLFPPVRSNRTWLIDNCGQVVNQWLSVYKPGLMAYLLDDGSLLRCGIDEFTPTFRSGGGVGGHLEITDWDGTVLWDYLLSDSWQCQHHDAIMLPSGNVLALTWELILDSLAIANGRDPALINEGELWGEKLVEIRPIYPDSGEIVWEWKVQDHLIQDFDSSRNNFGVVGDHPELMDYNFDPFSSGKKDWLHCNGIAFNPDQNQVVLSSRNTSEIYIIDHSTTTTEAASHSGGRSNKGGDFLWRWGNPEVYRQGTATDRQFFWQHNPNWIAASYVNGGKMLVFNNGTFRPGLDYSSADMLELSPDSNGNYAMLASGTFAPDSLHWQYTAPNPPDLHSPFISGVQGLPNGNVLIADGNHGTLSEVNLAGTRNWNYRNPDIGHTIVSQNDTIPGYSTTNQWVNAIFRAVRYLPDYPGLDGRDLTPGPPIESDPFPVPCFLLDRAGASKLPQIRMFPNPVVHTLLLKIPDFKPVQYRIVDVLGRLKETGTLRGGSLEVQVDQWEAGWYFVQVEGHRAAGFAVIR
jgi:hypothetical protein